MEPTGIAAVTGASRGLGRAVALELARAGFDVLATMRRPADGDDLVAQARDAGLRLRVAALDVTRPDTIVLPAGLRVLVNNAGIETGHQSIEATPVEAWREVLETNLIGVVEVTRRALPVLRESGGGVVCMVTSASLFAPMPFFAVYRATKAAVSALCESLRAEAATFGVRVVEIMPGPVATDMHAGSEEPLEALDEPVYRALAERVTALRAQSASVATPAEEAARAVVAAVLDDGGPMRHACDPLGAAMLERWRGCNDEEMMRGMLGAFAPTSTPTGREPSSATG